MTFRLWRCLTLVSCLNPNPKIENVPPPSSAILTVCSKYEFSGPSGLMVAVQMSMRKWADEVEARVI